MDGYHCRIEADGVLVTAGVDWGTSPIVVHRTKAHIIARWPGHRCWSGVGRPWSYFPTHYVVFKIKSQNHDEHYPLRLESIRTLEFGRRWKKGLQQLIEEFSS